MLAGTPEQLRDAQARAAALAHKVAELLNRLDAIYPGSTHSGQVIFLGGDITGRGGRWTVNTDH